MRLTRKQKKVFNIIVIVSSLTLVLGSLLPLIVR